MPTYLHCLLRAESDPPPPIAGVAGSPVRALRAGSLAAWVTDLGSPAAPAATPDSAAAHDAVAQAAVERGDDVVPARFGQWFESDATCLRDLSRREDAVLRALAHVRGCVERRLIVPLVAGDPGSPGVARQGAGGSPRAGRGREYLARLRSEQSREWIVQQTAERARTLIEDRMSAHVHDSSFRIAVLPIAALTMAHLVARAHEAEYASALAALREEESLRDAVATGPWAPYSFTGLADD